MAEDWESGGFGLYIHWPFCQAKCPYCDFNSHVAREIDQAAWLDAYIREIKRYSAMLPGRVLTSVFFGGGTPSLMAPETVAGILDEVRQAWPMGNDPEITLEANPGSVEAGRFAGYAQAGVSRVSIGVQALNDADLKTLGRVHSVAEAYQAVDIAKKYFGRVSFDLIYARQYQTVSDWQAELKKALEMAADHLSLYQLTIESGTAFGDRYAKGKLKGLPIDDTSAEMFEITQELCAAAGLPAYEVSNHARPGSESRHNLIYWRYGDYVGIGPGAHGRVTFQGRKHATEAWSMPARWLEGADTGISEKAPVILSGSEQAGEYLMMGLRINDGIDLERYQALSGQPISQEKLDHLSEIGMIERRGKQLRTTTQGRMLLNMVIETLLPDQE